MLTMRVMSWTLLRAIQLGHLKIAVQGVVIKRNELTIGHACHGEMEGASHQLVYILHRRVF